MVSHRAAAGLLAAIACLWAAGGSSALAQSFESEPTGLAAPGRAGLPPSLRADFPRSREPESPPEPSQALEPSAAPEPSRQAPVEPVLVRPRPRPPPDTSLTPGLASIRGAWQAPAPSLDERVTQTRRAALQHGVWNLDAAAHALVAAPVPGAELERARAAVRLAPDLPSIRMVLARALWLADESPIAALREVAGALWAIAHHPEASLWFTGVALYVLAMALCAGGLLYIGISAALAVRHAAHDLGDVVSGGGELPAFARAAILSASLLLPACLGEGVLGVCLGLLAIGVLYGPPRQQIVLATAALALVLGANPVARLAGALLTAQSADPVVEAAYVATRGFAGPPEIQRLEAAADEDPLALQALAVVSRRAGRLSAADASYQTLLELGTADPTISNNAANVRNELGHMQLALDLYRRAAEARESPAVLFNLAQGYGRSFQVEDLNRTLAAAQKVDGRVVAELTQLQGSGADGFAVDLPMNARSLWRRAVRSPAGAAFAREFRRPIAPGVLGRDWRHAAGGFGAVALLASIAAFGLRPSQSCHRCGRRICPRCDPESGGSDTCEGCTRLFHQPETTDRALRLARVNALRERDRRLARVRLMTSVLLPGTAGLFASSYWMSLFGTLLASLALAAVAFGAVVADPLVVGGAGPVAFGVIAVVAGLTYAIVLLWSLAIGRQI